MYPIPKRPPALVAQQPAPQPRGRLAFRLAYYQREEITKKQQISLALKAAALLLAEGWCSSHLPLSLAKLWSACAADLCKSSICRLRNETWTSLNEFVCSEFTKRPFSPLRIVNDSLFLVSLWFRWLQLQINIRQHLPFLRETERRLIGRLFWFF